MSQAKLQRFKTYPTNFLFREFFRLEVNYMHPIELPTFPKELHLDSSELMKALEKVSAFAVSGYLIQDLTNMKPRSILKNLVSQPQKIFTVISQAKSKSLESSG